LAQHVVLLPKDRHNALLEVVDGKVDAGVRLEVVDGKVLGIVGEVERSCIENLLVNPGETNLSVNFAVNLPAALRAAMRADSNDSHVSPATARRVPHPQDSEHG
jgi:hypothetical protein